MSPREAKSTPICEIYMALDGKFEYLRKASVFNGGPVIEEKPQKQEKLSGDEVANKLKTIFGKMSDG